MSSSPCLHGQRPFTIAKSALICIALPCVSKRCKLQDCKLPEEKLPTYDRANVRPGWVHFGFGAFHRSHQAAFIDHLLQHDFEAAKDFGICGVGVLPQDARMRDVMRKQDGLYTLIKKPPEGEWDVRVIGSIVEYLFAPDEREAVLQRMAHPDTRILSLTIGEGGCAAFGW